MMAPGAGTCNKRGMHDTSISPIVVRGKYEGISNKMWLQNIIFLPVYKQDSP
jgi:hypothetical protein